MPVQMGVGSYSLASEEFGPDIRIGNYCSIAKDVVFIGAAEHNWQWATTYPLRIKLNLPNAYHDGHPKTKGPIIVGHDVWIGMRVTILSGVTIGNGAVVGAGAVVAKSIPPYAIVAGNPAKVLRFRFSDEVIAGLQALQWWNWSEDKIRRHVDLLSRDPGLLLEKRKAGEL